MITFKKIYKRFLSTFRNKMGKFFTKNSFHYSTWMLFIDLLTKSKVFFLFFNHSRIRQFVCSAFSIFFSVYRYSSTSCGISGYFFWGHPRLMLFPLVLVVFGYLYYWLLPLVFVWYHHFVHGLIVQRFTDRKNLISYVSSYL